MPRSHLLFSGSDDVERHAADVLNLDLHRFAVLQRAEPFVVGAAGDQVAGVERHDGRGELDELRNAVLHVVGVVVVAKLSIVPEAHDQIVGVRDFVGGRDAGADRREGVEGLAEPAVSGVAARCGGPARARRRRSCRCSRRRRSASSSPSPSWPDP